MNKKYFLATILSCGILALSFTENEKPSLKAAMKSLTDFCSFIPSGSVQIDESTVTTQSFYMSSTEVTNAQYAEFLADLERTGDVEGLAIAKIDTAGWVNMDPNAYYDPYSTYYHVHPAYQNYPVVNISRDAADLYCTWLSKKFERLSNGELLVKFRVPTRAEWIHAARGGVERSPYSWGGTYLRNEKGQKLANYLSVDAENVTRDEATGELKVVQKSFIGTSDGAYITAPVKSYGANAYGVYEMNGNVAEMISDGNFVVGGSWNSPGFDIRNESMIKFEGRHPTVGFRVVATYFD